MKRTIIIILIAVSALAAHASARKAQYNAFTMSAGYEQSYIDAYTSLIENRENILMTSDFLFYLQHLAVDYSLRYMENTYMYGSLARFLDDMIIDMMIMYSDNDELAESYEIAMGYLYTAKALLDPETIVPERFSSKVNAEMQYVQEHSKIAVSPLFGREEDYSQYKPRGHYNDTEKLQRYFRSMMWLQRMRFVTEIKKADDKYMQLKSALLLSSAFSKHDTYFDENIYRPVSILLQGSDDMRISELTDIWASLGYSDSELPDKEALARTAKKCAEMNKAKIVSDIIDDNDEMPVFVGIMGQRYIFDSEVFQNLVYNKVGLYTGSNNSAFTLGDDIRVVPRGLDLFYVLGSTQAYLLMEKDGDVQYIGYRENASAMRKVFSGLDKQTNYYNRVLNQFTIVLNHKKDNVPEFMLDERWYRKELNSMLAAWASLRHDVILYAKQSYTIKATAKMPGSSDAAIICEPYTELYKTMKKDMDFLFTTLGKQTGDAVFSDLNTAFGIIIQNYMDISALTLKNQAFTDKEELLNAIGVCDYYLKQLIHDKEEKQDNAVIVADVHSDPNSMTVLEEAVGPPSYIDAEHRGESYSGLTMSYFEFKGPIEDRMTDEEWREKVKTTNINELLFKWQKPLYDKNYQR